MAITIKDVAARCGLSVSTVSKAFNHYCDISEHTREMVQRTAREMGYFPNAIARALKANRSYNLGVLFVDGSETGLTHDFFAAVLEGFKAEAERCGYDMTFINHHIGRTAMSYLEHCRYRNVDGICLACVDFHRKFGMKGKHPADLCPNIAAGKPRCPNCDGSCSTSTSASKDSDVIAEITKRVLAQLGK